MKDLRIVFMGTPEFAVATLDALVESGYDIVGVVTAPDRPAGRGRKLNESAVKRYAVSKGLFLLQPTNLKNVDFLKSLESLKADLQIVVAFRMLPAQVWKMPRLGTFNLHASLLPEYRGAAPINWAIINGEKKTGVTTFFIDEKIDTGNIIKQREVSIGEDTTAGELHDVLMKVGSQLVLDTVEAIEGGNAIARVQKGEAFKQAPKLNKENCRIDWNRPMKGIYDQIRGLSPYPAAWTFMRNQEEEIELKIYRTAMIPEEHDLAPGTIRANKKKILVAVSSGYLDILELQLAGKRKMDAVSLLNGYRFEPGAIMF